MKAAIYSRFSSTHQSELSIEAQERACLTYANQKGYEVVAKYADEAISGKTTNRASYQKMMKDAAKNKFDVLLIHKYDRLSRNLGDAVNTTSKLNNLGVELIAVAQDFGNSKEGKLMRGIQWVLADYYVENLAEETRKGLQETALKGLHNGGYAPFGYDIVDQKYVINEKEAYYVKRMFECCVQREGYKDLIKEMAVAGIKGKRGKPITQTSIHEILRNEKYTGVYVYSLVEEKNRDLRRSKPNAIRVENALPVIIKKDLWDEAQKTMNARASGPHRKDVPFYSGKVYCGKCGAKMYHINSVNKRGSYEYLVCSNHCGNRVAKVEDIERQADLFVSRVNRSQIREELADAMNEYRAEEQRALIEFEQDRAKKLKEVQCQIDAIIDNIGKNLPQIVVDVMAEKLASLKTEQERIESLRPTTHYAADEIENWMQTIIKAPEENLKKLIIGKIIVKEETTVFQSTLLSILVKDDKNCGEGSSPKKEKTEPDGSVVGNCGCGGSQPYVPTTLLMLESQRA